MDIQTAINSFIKAARADGLRPATIKWYSSLLGSFAADFQTQEISSVTTDELRDYIISLRERDEKYVDAPQKPVQEGGFSEATIAGHVTALHAFWAWSANEYDIRNPMKNIKRPKRRNPVPKAIAQQDYMKLFNATGEGESGVRDRAILAFFADTGCRLGGLLSLTLGNLDLQQRRAVVIEKGGKSRTIVFTFYTAQLLHKWLYFRSSDSDRVFVSMSTGKPLTESGVNQVLKRLKARAKVTGRVNPHSFRHNFAREYIKNGGDVVTLAKLLGHSDVQTTAAYYAVFTNDELAELHEKFSPMNQLKA
jgi:site-specific recombinase XerD